MVQLQLTGSNNLFFEIIITVFVIILCILVFLILMYLKKLKKDAPLKGKSKTRSPRNLSREITSMLTKHGKGLTQKEIADNLSFPPHFVAQKLLEMEDKGLIAREWENDEFKYTTQK
jgi:hypothetical protein